MNVSPIVYQIDLRKLAQGEPDNLQRFYLSWVNEFLTVYYMAQFYGIKIESCQGFIEQGRAIHESRCAAAKEILL